MKLHRGSGIRLGRKFPIVYGLAISRNLEDFLILNLPHLGYFCYLVVFSRIK